MSRFIGSFFLKKANVIFLAIKKRGDKVKCLSIDLDGTLLNDKKEISEENKRAIFHAKKQGIEVVINTGRSMRQIEKIPDVFSLNCPLFAMNGTILYSEKKEVLKEISLPHHVYEQVIFLLKKWNVGMIVHTNVGVFPDHWGAIKSLNNEGKIKKMFEAYDYLELLEKKNILFYKIVVILTEETKKEIKEILHKQKEINVTATKRDNLEINCREAEKGKAILMYAKLKKVVYDKIYAIGDNENDLPQFSVATTSIVMENAEDEIKKHADIQTLSNNEHGVAYAIENYIVKK